MLRQELLLTLQKTIEMKKNEKSSPETPERPDTPETPETKISYVQKYERLISFRKVVMKTQNRPSLSPETAEPPAVASDDPVGRLPSDRGNEKINMSSLDIEKNEKPSPPRPPQAEVTLPPPKVCGLSSS